MISLLLSLWLVGQTGLSTVLVQQVVPAGGDVNVCVHRSKMRNKIQVYLQVGSEQHPSFELISVTIRCELFRNVTTGSSARLMTRGIPDTLPKVNLWVENAGQ